MAMLFFRVIAGTAGLAVLGALAVPAAAQSSTLGDPYKRAVPTAPSDYWGYTYNPYAGYSPLHGVAAIIEAQGDFLLKVEEANLRHQDVIRARLETRRVELEHWVWEREFRAGLANRQRDVIIKTEAERARRDPPQTEIHSGKSLNDILKVLKETDAALLVAGSTPITAECLKNINRSPDGYGNVALLKYDKLPWPQLLLRDDFTDLRDKIDKLVAEVKKQMPTIQGYPPGYAEMLTELNRLVRACRARKTAANQRDAANQSHGDESPWSARHYTGAGQFLQQLEEAIKVLEKGEAEFFSKPPRGRTVAELVANMKGEGALFGPADPGRERYYRILHHALADELTRLQNREPATHKP